MKTVTIAKLAASHGSAAREGSFRNIAEFKKIPEGSSWDWTVMKTAANRR